MAVGGVLGEGGLEERAGIAVDGGLVKLSEASLLSEWDSSGIIHHSQLSTKTG